MNEEMLTPEEGQLKLIEKLLGIFVYTEAKRMLLEKTMGRIIDVVYQHPSVDELLRPVIEDHYIENVEIEKKWGGHQ